MHFRDAVGIGKRIKIKINVCAHPSPNFQEKSILMTTKTIDNHLRLGLNIDHIATVRNARECGSPDVFRAARLGVESGIDGLTVHLREDRRHIRDADVTALAQANLVPLNLEMAATEEMQAIALREKPNGVCLVPEKREELTTEGGLDVAGQEHALTSYIQPLKKCGIRVSLFIDPDARQIRAAAACGADVVELHTGTYADAHPEVQEQELERIRQGTQLARECGLEVHAGHGLNFENVGKIAEIRHIVELNIGHFIIGEALFLGLGGAIKEMRRIMDLGRSLIQ